MGTRIRGAVLAFAAALLVAASIPLAWWSGPPVDEGTGRVVEGKSVAIGLLGFEGCRAVGSPEESCMHRKHTDAKSGLHAGMDFAVAGFATLASALLAAVLMVGQGVSSLATRRSLRRKLAIGSVIASAFVGVSGAAFVLFAPDTHGVPRGIGPFVAFGGAALGIVQALLAMRPEREPVAKAPRAPKPPKPAKVKAAKPAKAPKPHRPELPPIAPPPPPPGGYPPIDFLALMEEDAGQETVPKVPAMPWGEHKQAAPSNALPGPAAVLGTSMPSKPATMPPPYPPMPGPAPPYPPMPSPPMHPPMPSPPMHPPMHPPMPAYGGNGGVPITAPNAPTMFPHAQVPPPPIPSAPPFPTAAPHAPTQAIVPVPSWLPPNPLPANPLVMPISGQTPPPGSLAPIRANNAEAPTQPPTAIPLPPLFGSPTAPVAPPAASPAPAPPPVATPASTAPTTPDAPPRTPPRKTAPPPIRGKPVTQQPPLVPPLVPPPPGSGAPATSPPPLGLPIPASAMAALGKPGALDADSRAGTDAVPALGDHTAPTDAVPEGAEPTDMGPVIDPPPPDDLDGRPDTASDMTETIERSGSEAEAMRAGLRRRETPPPFKTVDRSIEDETVPRERPSASQILTSAPKTPAPTPVKPATTPPPVAKTPIPISTASPDLPPPSEGQVAADGPAPACPQCDSPMNWVEKHLRFYCQTCRMYF